MPKIHYFKSKNCPRCAEAEGVIARLRGAGKVVDVHDIEKLSGLTEAAFYGILSTPTILIEQDEQKIAAWHVNIDENAILAKLGELEGISDGE